MCVEKHFLNLNLFYIYLSSLFPRRYIILYKALYLNMLLLSGGNPWSPYIAPHLVKKGILENMFVL